MDTVTNQQLPPEFDVTATSQNVIEEVIDNRPYVVVYVGDVLTLAQKHTPLRRLGGRLYNDSKCLRDKMVPRCSVYPLEEGMLGVNKFLIAEAERPKYIQHYTRTNVLKWNPRTMKKEFTTVAVGLDDMTRDQIYKKVFPSQEIGMIAQQGVVAIEALSDPREIKEAQFHYFPNWFRIIQGLDKLPATIRELEEYLGNRLAQSNNTMLKRVGTAYLESCQQYRIWGTEYVKFQTEQIKKAEGTAGAQRYDEIGENLFTQLELTRQDSLIQSFAKQQTDTSKTNELMANAISLMTQILLKGQNNPELPAAGQMAGITDMIAQAAEVQTATPLDEATVFAPASTIENATPVEPVLTDEQKAQAKAEAERIINDFANGDKAPDETAIDGQDIPVE